MRHSTKIILNTGTLYVKIIVSCIVQLLATRIALHALGDDAFGLYNLIAGVIVLLSFFTGALMISAQRFMSIAIGENNELRLASIFNVSLLIHLIFAGIICVLFFGLQSILFNGFLKYPPELGKTAVWVYDIMIVSTAFTVITIPYSANINAREDMWYFAITEVVSAILKLWAACSLLLLKGDLLIIYSLFMSLAIIIGALMKVLWCRLKYKESKMQVKLMCNKALFKEMFGFVGWNTLGSAAVVIRNQGVAVLLNLFFGTVVNAAYGIANQVNSLVLSFASTLTTVFTPSIVKEKGAGNHERMISIAVFSSKLSFYLSSIMAIPLLVYTEELLSLWLTSVPTETVNFTRCIICSFLILQFYPGINRAIYATGNIKNYQIQISICLVAILPLGLLFFKFGMKPYSILILMSILQFITLLITIYCAKKECGLNGKKFFVNSVVIPGVLLVICIILTSLISCFVTSRIGILILVCGIAVLIYSILFFVFVLDKEEKKLLRSIIPIKNRNVA